MLAGREAEAATLISDALKESGPGVIEVRRIDVRGVSVLLCIVCCVVCCVV